MLTQGEDVEVHALAGRGWSISAIARHLGRDRKTVRVRITLQSDQSFRSNPISRFGGFRSPAREAVGALT